MIKKGQKESVRSLIDTSSGEIPLYVSYKGSFINSVFLPQYRLKGDYIADLMKWECRPERSWEYGYSPAKHRALKHIPVLSPFAFSKSRLLRSATPITIIRKFEGMVGPKSYIVINQLLTHPNDLHFEKERSAYCRLNEAGEVEDIIRIRHLPGDDSVTIRQDVLDRHLFLTKSVLVRFFELTLYDERGGRQETTIADKKNKIYARKAAAFDTAALDTATDATDALRGFQVIGSRLRRAEGARLLSGSSPASPASIVT